MPDFKESIVSEEKARYKTLDAFNFFLLFIAVCIVGFNVLRSRPDDNGAAQPLRDVMNTNEKIFSSIISDNHLAKNLSPECSRTQSKIEWRCRHE